MILTTCAACAAPLAHDAPRCVRCKTRYCNATCQHDHWRRGHKQICKKIHRGGNAEQYYADKKYKEAVAVAVEACAEDTKGHVDAGGRPPMVSGTALSTDLTEGKLKTVQGEPVDVTLDPIAINGAGVAIPDVLATNGVVHVIDAVLIPPEGL